MTIREAARAEIQITTPQTSGSGMWELSTDRVSRAAFDNFWVMVDYLADRYDGGDPDDDAMSGNRLTPRKRPSAGARLLLLLRVSGEPPASSPPHRWPAVPEMARH